MSLDQSIEDVAMIHDVEEGLIVVVLNWIPTRRVCVHESLGLI